MTYEFKDTEAKVIADVGIRGLVIGFLLIATGLLDGLGTLFSDVGSSEKALVVTKDIFIMLIGVLFLLPFDNLRKVDTTEGQDVKELMEGIRRLNVSLLGMFAFLIVVLFLELMRILAVSN
ncbi:MAG: hypothetical protein IH840_16830 [Candidatus Heimdallarchaeota archaeon]|nr:hypothetical protein [Candidatus Heimdallarchaeota archaeon]